MSLWLSTGCYCCSRCHFSFTCRFPINHLLSLLFSFLPFPHICFWKYMPKSTKQIGYSCLWATFLHLQLQSCVFSTSNLIISLRSVISDHLLLLIMFSLIGLNGTIDSDWRSGWHGQAETSVKLYSFSFHTCTINYFEGDSYELTTKSKSIIFFHYYANYA